MSAEYKVPYSELEVFSYDLILRYDNKLLGDTIERVGKDTKRKLSENDRFVGAIRLCQKHGIEPSNIIRGMAAGLLFCPESDTASVELNSFLRENGVSATLEKYCGITRDEDIAALIAKEYEKLI
jgi:mannitol-1-phosphate 5-dehydrogenase